MTPKEDRQYRALTLCVVKMVASSEFLIKVLDALQFKNLQESFIFG